MIVMIVVIVVALVIFFSSVDSEKSTASFTTSAVVLFKGESIWVPTRVKRPRHQRFLSKPLRSAPAVETLSRDVSGMFVLLLLISGDVELNPGPSEETRSSGSAISHHSLSTNAECGGSLSTVSDNSLKRTSVKENKDCICPICEDQILEAKGRRKGHDAIFCDGTCQSWLHRGCAGLSRKAFEAQVNSNGEFYCPTCHLNVFESIMADMKRELTTVKNALSTISAHIDQEKDSGTISHQLHSVPKSYASVLTDGTSSLPPRVQGSDHVLSTTEIGEGARGRKNRVKRKSAGAGNHTQWVNVSHLAGRSAKQVQQKSTNPQLSNKSFQVHKQKIKISGLRKVWGSMRSCTANAMAKTISSLCPTMANKIQVRRKYKITSSGQVGLWWFLIRGDEEVLLELDKIWSTVAVQTSWKLQDCVKFTKPRGPQSSTVPVGTTSEGSSLSSLGASVSQVSASQSGNSSNNISSPGALSGTSASNGDDNQSASPQTSEPSSSRAIPDSASQ